MSGNNGPTAAPTLSPDEIELRRHGLVERLLADVLRVPWSRVHAEAERWDGVISAEVESRLVDLLGDPDTCPHGNPLPGSAPSPRVAGAVALVDAPTGPAQVVRILESLEDDAEAMQLLERSGLTPGRDLEVLMRDTEGTVHVVGAIADVTLPPRITRAVHVLPRS